MSGQWWENDLIVGPFSDIPAANAWAAANPSALFPGLLATAGGVQIRWGGVGVGWGEDVIEKIRRLAANPIYPGTPAVAPTIAVSAANTSTQISGGVVIANNDPRIRYGSDMIVSGAAYPDDLTVRGQSVNCGAWPPVPGRHDNRTCPEFYTDAAAVEFQVKGQGSCKFRIYYMEPGDIWRVAGDVSTVPSDGNFYRVKTTFASGGVPRRIRIEGFAARWTDFVISPTGMLWSVPDVDVRAIVLGDSFTEGDSGISGVFGPMDNWAARLGWIMGWGDTWLSGVGGTGYVAAPDGKLKLSQRIVTDIGTYAPDVIVIADGLNDVGQTAEAIATEVSATLTEIRKISQAPVFIVGSWNPKSCDVSAINAWIMQGAAGFTGIYTLMDLLYNGTGRRGQTAGNGNSDLYVGEDNAHPTLLGHKYLAERVREQILAAIS